MADINTLGVDTLGAVAEVVETPDLGQVEAVEDIATEQVETGTDNTGMEFTPERYKNLQSEFTKKSQEYSEFKKRTDKDAIELNNFRQMYQTEQVAKQTPATDTSKPLSAKDFANLEPMEQLNYLVDQRINETVNPYLDRIGQLENYIQRNNANEAQTTWDKFVEAHPDAANMAGELSQTITQYNMPLDKAYKLLKADMAMPEAKQEVLREIQVKKDASKLMKPVSTPTTPTNSKVNSFEEAYEKTLKELGIK